MSTNPKRELSGINTVDYTTLMRRVMQQQEQAMQDMLIYGSVRVFAGVEEPPVEPKKPADDKAPQPRILCPICHDPLCPWSV